MGKSVQREKVKAAETYGCLNFLVLLSCFVVISAHFVSSFFAGGRLWGINHLAYFPLEFNILLTVLCLFLLIRSINYRIQSWLGLLFDPIYHLTIGKSKKLWFVLFSLMSFPFFWIFRTRTHFLGDSYQIIGNFQSGGFFVKWSELGESLIHIHLYKLMDSVLTIDPRVFYELSSCFFGVIFIYLLFLLADFLGQDKGEKLFLFLLVAFMGSIQLFCGYIENYSLTYLLIFAFILSGLKYLKGHGKTFLPVLLYALAVFSHVSSSYFLPAVFVLYVLGPRKNGGSSLIGGKNRWALLFLVVLTFLIYFYMKEYSWMVGNKFVPLFKGDYYGPGYTLFSPPHLLDIINQQLLAAPVGLLLLASVWICTGSFNLKDRSVLFLSVVFLLGMGFNFVMYPGLGMSKDWDMFSSASIGYTILAAYLFLKITRKGFNLKYPGSILVLTTVFCTLPWVLSNASEQRGVERFRHLLNLDPKKSRSGHYVLAAYFERKGLADEILKEYQVQATVFPELILVNQGVESFQDDKLYEAFELGKKALETEPSFAEAHLLLGTIHDSKGDHHQAQREFRLAMNLKPGDGKVYLDLGNHYVITRSSDSALHYYKKALALNVRDPNLYNNMGNLYSLKEEWDKAIRSYKKALKIDPNLAESYYGLGVLSFNRNEVDQAISYFKKACEKKPDFALAHYHLAYIYAQRGEKEEAEQELNLFMDFAPDKREAEEAKQEIELLLGR